MTAPDIKTFLVDGGMPGCGRSLAVRMLTDMYQHGHDTGYLRMTEGRIPKCRVYVWDACNDSDTKTGYQLWHERGTATVHTGRFGTEEGARAYERIVELARAAAEVTPVRVIIDLPAEQNSEILRDWLKPEILAVINTIPVWLLTRQAMSLGLLADRVAVMPEIYRRRGVVLRNSWFSTENGFVEWTSSGLRRALIEHGDWQDIFMLALNHYAKKAMDNRHVNMPFDIANEQALEDWAWMHWWRVGLQLFRGESMFRCNRVESL
ncbi:hypothetical protein ACQUQQ_08630 [Acidithiobacillus ferrooxidans]|uniref:hypothetical protein n=1 Tax=Acidithiobacillus ferrooxidans TaxID=920 RepID=UPI000B265694